MPEMRERQVDLNVLEQGVLLQLRQTVVPDESDPTCVILTLREIERELRSAGYQFDHMRVLACYYSGWDWMRVTVAVDATGESGEEESYA